MYIPSAFAEERRELTRGDEERDQRNRQQQTRKGQKNV